MYLCCNAILAIPQYLFKYSHSNGCRHSWSDSQKDCEMFCGISDPCPEESKLLFTHTTKKCVFRPSGIKAIDLIQSLLPYTLSQPPQKLYFAVEVGQIALALLQGILWHVSCLPLSSDATTHSACMCYINACRLFHWWLEHHVHSIYPLVWVVTFQPELSWFSGCRTAQWHPLRDWFRWMLESYLVGLCSIFLEMMKNIDFISLRHMCVWDGSCHIGN